MKSNIKTDNNGKESVVKPLGRPRKSTQGDSLKVKLISAGLDLLRSESLESLSLRKVSATAGVSHAAAYRYFENKNALLAAIAEEGYNRFYEYQNQAIDEAAGDFEARFRNLGWTYVRFTLENPGYARIMFGGAGLDIKTYPALIASATRSSRVLQNEIREGQRQGFISQGNLKQKTLAARSMVHGVAMLLLDGQLSPRPTLRESKKMVLSIIEYVFTGMAAG